jgi:Fe-S-cluster-containing hydrogenase component 2
MAIRKIIKIDEDKCDGCGLCIPNCAEGALQIIDGKVRLIHDKYCDGLGDCLGHCPQDALHLIEREAEEFDEEAVEELLRKQQVGTAKVHMGCPGSRVLNVEKEHKVAEPEAVSSSDVAIKIKSQLTHWPVQLELVPPNAAFLKGADLLVTADCVPFAYPNYHLELLKGKKTVVGCPKLDDLRGYVDKLIAIIKNNDLNSITVAFMEVPCCTGLVRAVEAALAEAGRDVPLTKIQISMDGEKEIIG